MNALNYCSVGRASDDMRRNDGLFFSFPINNSAASVLYHFFFINFTFLSDEGRGCRGNVRSLLRERILAQQGEIVRCFDHSDLFLWLNCLAEFASIRLSLFFYHDYFVRGTKKLSKRSN